MVKQALINDRRARFSQATIEKTKRNIIACCLKALAERLYWEHKNRREKERTR